MKKTNNKEKHENKSFADIIRELRVQNKLTQKELADKIGVSDRTISKWEKGSSVPDLVCLTNICKELGVSPSLMINYKYSFKDRLNKAKLSLRKLLKFLTNNIFVVFFFIIFILLFIYFINNYNAVKIYRIKYDSENIKFNRAYFFRTKAVNILFIDNIKLCKIDYEPKTIKVELYTYHNGDKYIIYEGNDLGDIYIEENTSNLDILSNEFYSNIKHSINLVINTTDNDGNNYTYKSTLTLNNKFKNDKLIYNENEDAKVNSLSTINNKSEYDIYSKNLVNNELIDLGYEYNKNDNVYTRIDEYGGKIEFRPNTGLIEYTNFVKNVKHYIVYYKKFEKVDLNITNINEKIIYLQYSLNNNIKICRIGNCKKTYEELEYFIGICNEINKTL